MGNIFTGSEIVELGIQIEKNGRDFYKAVVSSVKNAKAKEIFLFLSSEEEKHIAVFKQILDSTRRYEPAPVYTDDYAQYMKALAGEYIFTQKDKGSEIARSVRSESEAVDLGIKFEKDSIIFYDGMKKVIPDFDLKIVSGLITQEQGHLMMLLDLKDKLK
ncbi:MAG: ferritin family protein [Candidatus Omnitrophica bacterium]|nr:ferritin family protein [Candidatus Omnitrophota bacterium]